MISRILYENNRGLETLLDPTKNQRFKERMSRSPKVRQLTNKVADPKTTMAMLRALNREIVIDRDVYVNRFVDRYIQSVRYADKSLNRNVNRTTDFAIDRNLEVFHFLDVNRDLYRNFDRVNLNVQEAT